MDENVRPDDMERITTPELAQAFIDEQVAAVREQIGDKKVLLALSGGSAFAAQWKLAHIRPADSVIERDLQAFAKEVREATSGRIDIRIYGSSQLGDYTVVQEKVSLGSVEMSCESVSTQVDKRFLSYILPYVAKDYATAKKNFGTGTPYAKYCANLFDKQDIMVLANWPVYFGGIGLVKAPPIPTPATTSKSASPP